MSKFIITMYILTTSAALVILKMGAKLGAPISINNGRFSFNINFAVILGVLLYGISFIIYTYLISSYDLGYIIPLTTAFVYVIIFVASYFIFNEVFTIMKVTAILLIIFGVILLNLSSR